ncbi:translation protein [Suillus plorans]|uniref:Translation protein n=1 Tax=Suillus plorans TaxID=116603 RepID=A0A9P7AAS5_9AGAM|nr:translation protein [Suillus plorans]KAG1784616.1 translation protein [Suillus plorans]
MHLMDAGVLKFVSDLVFHVASVMEAIIDLGTQNFPSGTIELSLQERSITVLNAISGIMNVRLKTSWFLTSIELGTFIDLQMRERGMPPPRLLSIVPLIVTHHSDTQPKYNIDTVNEYIIKRVPMSVRDFASDPRLIVIRSSDVNMSAAEVDELKSGVLSSQTSYGLGKEVKIRPGIVTNDTGLEPCKPIFSRIVSLHAKNNHLEFAFPGGLIGIRTKIDPTLCRADGLVGQVLGAIAGEVVLLRRIEKPIGGL